MSGEAGENCFKENVQLVGQPTLQNAERHNLYKGLFLLSESVTALKTELHDCRQAVRQLSEQVTQLEHRVR